jgi:glycosyltransferase involved in cell wall biosynthesis
MNVAIIVRRLNVRGGTQRQAVSLAKELVRQGHSVTFYTFIYSPKTCYEELREYTVISLEHAPSLKQGSGVVSALFSYFKNYREENELSKRLALKISPDTDILNPHDQLAYRVAYYYKREVNAIPSVWMMNDLPTRAFALYREGTFDRSICRSFLKKIFNWIADWYEIKKFISVQDQIAVLDNRDKEWVKKSFKKDAVVVRSGIDSQYFPYRERNAPPDKKGTILLQGIFMPHRCFEDAVLAVALLRKKGYDMSVRIVGGYKEGSWYYKKIKNAVAENGLESSVVFEGSVTDAELLRSYQKADVLVFPNHLQSWGLAVFEAMASGLPVIVSKGAGAHEVLTDKQNALLVPPRSPSAIADAIEELWANPVLYRQLSAEGRIFTEKSISWSKYADQMISLFQSAIKK